MSGVTDPASPYFKDGQWGWDGTVWRKLPMVWGYSALYAERKSNLSATAGTNVLVGSTVPAGEVWVVEVIGAFDVNTAPSRISFAVTDGTTAAPLYRDETPILYVASQWTGRVTLPAGCYIQVAFFTCVLNDDLYADFWGYKMKIAE